MPPKTRAFRIVDALLLGLMLLPLIAGMVLNVLVSPYSTEIEISGALIYFTIPMPLQDLPITESQVNSWLVMLSLFALCLYLTHGLSLIHI